MTPGASARASPAAIGDAAGEAAPVRRIVVLRALPGLGDMLCAVPAFRALRAGHPEARISLCGLPGSGGFVRRFGAYLDDLIVFPGFPGIPERPEPAEPLTAFRARMRAGRVDLAVQMQGDGTVINDFLPCLSARRAVTCTIPGAPEPLGVELWPHLGGAHEVHRCLDLAARAGGILRGDALEFPIAEHERAEWVADAPQGRYACVHAGSSLPDRRWPAERFARVADGLAERGLAVLLTGTAGEREVTAAVARAMTRPATDLAGRLSLGAMAACLDGAALVVTNDTGISHLAAAVRAPSVVIFSAAEPYRWAPLDRERHRAVVSRRLAARSLPSMRLSASDVPEVGEVWEEIRRTGTV